jgi:hypothetical protein
MGLPGCQIPKEADKEKQEVVQAVQTFGKPPAYTGGSEISGRPDHLDRQAQIGQDTTPEEPS